MIQKEKCMGGIMRGEDRRGKQASFECDANQGWAHRRIGGVEGSGVPE